MDVGPMGVPRVAPATLRFLRIFGVSYFSFLVLVLVSAVDAAALLSALLTGSVFGGSAGGGGADPQPSVKAARAQQKQQKVPESDERIAARLALNHGFCVESL